MKHFNFLFKAKYQELLICVLIVTICISCGTNKTSTNESLIITDNIVYRKDTYSFLQKFNISDSIYKIIYDGFVTNTVPPEYPSKAKRTGITGEVWLKVLVDSLGDVIRSEVMTSDQKIFNQPCLVAVMEWKFNPIALPKGPATWISIPFRFK